jgi:hypothetical protein
MLPVLVSSSKGEVRIGSVVEELANQLGLSPKIPDLEKAVRSEAFSRDESPTVSNVCVVAFVIDVGGCQMYWSPGMILTLCSARRRACRRGQVLAAPKTKWEQR